MHPPLLEVWLLGLGASLQTAQQRATPFPLEMWGEAPSQPGAMGKPRPAFLPTPWDLLVGWHSRALPLPELQHPIPGSPDRWATDRWSGAGPCPWPADLTSQLDLGPVSSPWTCLATPVAVTTDCQLPRWGGGMGPGCWVVPRCPLGSHALKSHYPSVWALTAETVAELRNQKSCLCIVHVTCLC